MTSTQELATIYLGRPIHEYLAEKRNAFPQWSWREIEQQLERDTNGRVAVSYATLRRWYAR